MGSINKNNSIKQNKKVITPGVLTGVDGPLEYVLLILHHTEITLQYLLLLKVSDVQFLSVVHHTTMVIKLLSWISKTFDFESEEKWELRIGVVEDQKI